MVVEATRRGMRLVDGYEVPVDDFLVDGIYLTDEMEVKRSQF